MTKDSFDGTWTLTVGDAAPEECSQIVVQGRKAWDAATPDAIGACTSDNGLVTIALGRVGKDGREWTEMIEVRPFNGQWLSGSLRIMGQDGTVEICDPCLLTRTSNVEASSDVG